MYAKSSHEDAADSFERSIAFFEKHRHELLRDYEGKFIAIIRDQVVDSDADWEVLARRVYQRLGYGDIFMPKVERQPRRTHIPSPQL